MRVGAHVEIDRMFLSKDNNGILKEKDNDGKWGLLVVVDLLSSYADAEAFDSSTVVDTAKLTRKILKRMSRKMNFKGGKCFSDAGIEFIGPRANRSNAFIDTVTSFGMEYSALPTRHTAPFVENKNGDIRRNLNSLLARTKSKRWVSVWRKILTNINAASFTDDRAGLTPNEIVAMSPKEQKKVAWEHKNAKGKRNSKTPGIKFKPLAIGSFVRIALEPKIKGPKM